VGGLVEAREQALDRVGVDVGDGAPVEPDRVIEDLRAQVPGELEVVEARREGEERAAGHASSAIVDEGCGRQGGK
jgi:hypothetical protein